MLIHHYDHATGQYLSSGLAELDSRNDERWIVPAFSTTVRLPARPPLTWPFFLKGKWQLLPDYRGRILYRQSTGEPVEILIAGKTPAESGLTELQRPSDKHVWDGKRWKVSAVAVKQAKREAVMVEFETRLTSARQMNFGKADAYAAGVLNEEEIYYFKAWSLYQMNLVRAFENSPAADAVVWPAEPGPYVPAAAEVTAPATPAPSA